MESNDSLPPGLFILSSFITSTGSNTVIYSKNIHSKKHKTHKISYQSMTHITCMLTAKNRDQFRNPTLGNRVWATFLPFLLNCKRCLVLSWIFTKWEKLKHFKAYFVLNTSAKSSKSLHVYGSFVWLYFFIYCGRCYCVCLISVC